MKFKLHHFLNCLAVLSVLLFSYPIVSMLLLLTGQRQGIASFLFTVPVILWGFLGYLCRFWLARLTQRGKLPVPVRKLLTICITVIPLVSFLGWNDSILFSVLMGVLCAVAFSLGNYYAPKPFQNIYHPLLFVWGIAINLICLAILWFWSFSEYCPYQVELFVLVFLIETLFYLLIQNQANIEYLMERRKHRLEYLPQKIRYYNILLLLVVFALILLLFLAKDWIVDLLELLKQAGRQLAAAFLAFLSFLSDLFRSDSVPPATEQGELGAAPPGSNSAEERYEWLLVFVIIAAVVFLVIYRKVILNWLGKCFKSFLALLKKLFLKESAFSAFQDQSDYYYDHVEDISSTRKDASESQEASCSNLRQWKKACKKYFKMKDPVERFRYGYRLANCWLSLKGADLLPSDTTLEILQKGKSYYQNTISDEITENYNQYRYQELPLPPDSLSLMDQLLRSFISQS